MPSARASQQVGSQLGGPLDLQRAIEHISRKVSIIRLTPECAEFMAKGMWFEIQEVPEGFRVRVYRRGGGMRTRVAANAVAAIDTARDLVRG